LTTRDQILNLITHGHLLLQPLIGGIAVSLLVSGLTMDILSTFCGVFMVHCVELMRRIFKAPLATARAPLWIGSVHLFVCLFVCLSVWRQNAYTNREFLKK